MATTSPASATTARPPSSSSSSSSETPTHGLDLAADDNWEDLGSDTEEVSFVSLFDGGASFLDLEAMLEHDRTRWGFDLKGEVGRLGLDFYGCIRLVNYVRSQVKKGVEKPDVNSKEIFGGDEYLKPVLEDDAVLFCLDDLVASVPTITADDEENGGDETLSKTAALERQLETLQKQFAEYRSTVEKTLDERWDTRESDPPKSLRKPSEREMDTQYFDSYSYYDIHETMLKDEVRTSAYRDFIYDNKHLFAGRIVLDIGCGTGILSLFAAKAGAAHVYAVDNSDIITKAREIIAENGLQDKITCIRGRIEDIALPIVPPGTSVADTARISTEKRGKAHVDIIVSEWFGYCLLYENMLDSVLHARDAYLASSSLSTSASASTSTSAAADNAAAPPAREPIMAPSHTTMHIAPLSDPDYTTAHITFWESVYGFSMAPILRGTNPFADVILRPVAATAVPAPSARFRTLDMYACARTDLEFAAAPFSFTLARAVPDGLDGFVLSFDVFFIASRAADLPADARAEAWPGKGREDEGVAFTTGVTGKETHWMQGCLMIDRRGQGGGPASPGRPLEEGQKITGAVGYKRSEGNSRELEITVSWEAAGTAERGEQVWFLR